MAFTKMTAKVENISALSDRPNEGTNGLTAAQLKAEFDKAGKNIKAFINSLIDEMAKATGAENIGASILRNNERESTTVQSAIDALVSAVDDINEGGAPIPSGAVTSTKIASSAVTTEKIADGAVTAGKIAANAVSAILTATIGTTWTGDAAPYTQTVSGITGLLASDNPIVDLVPSSTYNTAKKQTQEWGSIYRIETAAGAITVYANEKTTESIPIRLLCIRK